MPPGLGRPFAAVLVLASVGAGAQVQISWDPDLAFEWDRAVLDHAGTAHRLPTWVNEGLAERLSWKRRGLEDLAPNQVWELKGALGEGRLLPLPARGYLTPFGYLQSYAAVLFLERKVGKERLLAIVRRTLDGEPFERALDAETRLTPAQLERELASWVEHL